VPQKKEIKRKKERKKEKKPHDSSELEGLPSMHKTLSSIPSTKKEKIKKKKTKAMLSANDM
jgi:hypothetical protein